MSKKPPNLHMFQVDMQSCSCLEWQVARSKESSQHLGFLQIFRTCWGLLFFFWGLGGFRVVNFLRKNAGFGVLLLFFFLVHQARWWVRLRLWLSLVYDLVYDFGVPPLGRQWFCLMLSQLLDDNSGVLDRALAALEDWGCWSNFGQHLSI